MSILAPSLAVAAAPAHPFALLEHLGHIAASTKFLGWTLLQYGIAGLGLLGIYVGARYAFKKIGVID